MALFERIAAAARVDLVRAGGMDLLAALDAEAFLEAAQRMRVGILGIEGLRISSGTVVSDMGAIEDYSSFAADPAFVNRSIAGARGFLVLIRGKHSHFRIKILGRNPFAE